MKRGTYTGLEYRKTKGLNQPLDDRD